MRELYSEGSKKTESLLNLVDFKWLMAGVGWWVNLSRLQRDGVYMHECLQRALTSDSELLRTPVTGRRMGRHDGALPSRGVFEIIGGKST